MRKFHTRKLYMPEGAKFDEVVRVYESNYRNLPVSITTLRKIIQEVTGWEIRGQLLPVDWRARVIPGNAMLIIVNSKTPLWQRRSDVAHEFGHILHSFYQLTDGTIINRINKMSKEEREQEEAICDEIGASLLCPEWAVEELVSQATQKFPELGPSELLGRLSRQFQFPRKELEAHLLRCYSNDCLEQLAPQKAL